MNITKPLLIGTAAILAAGATTAGAVTGTAAQARATDGDADVAGKRVTLQAETSASTQRVTFRYGGKRYSAALTETDSEDRTKACATSRRSAPPGRTITFRARACDASGCSTTRFTEVVEWDD